MVRDGIDRRRRQLLRIVAAATGVGTVEGASASGRSSSGADADDGRPALSSTRRGGPMTDLGNGAGPDFVVSRAYEDSRSGTTKVLRRGEGAVVFEGAAAAALEHATAAGDAAGTGTVVAVAPGTYTLARPVRLPSSTYLAGSGTATTLRAGSDLTGPIVEVATGADHTRVSDLRLVGRADDGRDREAPALAVGGDAWRPVLEHLVIRDAPGHGIRFTGGSDNQYSYEPVLSDIDVARCGGDGFVFGHTGDMFGVNLYAEACGGCGFTMADAGGTLVHPHAYDSQGQAGIRVTESAKDLAMFGPHAERNRRHGVIIRGERITIRNGFIANNSRDVPGSYDGLTLEGARDSLVSESAFLNDPDRGHTQRHGVVETSTSQRNVISGNLFQNNTDSPVERPTTSVDSRYRDNRGYRTATGGETTVRNGDRIHHGLDERPTQYSVESTSPGVYAHVIDVDESSLIVEVLSLERNSRQTEPVDVSWQAVVR